MKDNLVELFAEQLTNLGLSGTVSDCENFAEYLIDSLADNLPADVEMTEEEYNTLKEYIQEFIEKHLLAEAKSLAMDYEKEAQDEYDDRQEALNA